MSHFWELKLQMDEQSQIDRIFPLVWVLPTAEYSDIHL